MRSARACAKINLALVVGPIRDDGKHEVVTVLQRIDLCDHVELELAEDVLVEGFRDDTLVATALRELGREIGTSIGAHVCIEKLIPVASGLGGGSSDAATALILANAELDEPLPREALHRVGARVGVDVPFFLGETTMLGLGDGTELTPVAVPLDYTIALVLPHGQAKASTEAVYQAFDERQEARGFDERREALLDALGPYGSWPISRACHETISPPHRSPPSSRSAERSVRTCRAPGRSSTGSSSAPTKPRARWQRSATSVEPGSRAPCRTDAPGEVARWPLSVGRGQVVRQRVLVP